MIVISLLRGVNIGPHHRIRMEPLRAMYEAAGLRDVRTLLQSGNVVFRCAEREIAKLGARLEAAMEVEFGFRAVTVLRTLEELRAVAAANPFAGRPDLDPAKLAVVFLGCAVDEAMRARLAAMRAVPEEVRTGSRELYIYYPAGMGRPVLTAAMLERAVGKTATTARNWNTVMKLVALGEELERGR